MSVKDSVSYRPFSLSVVPDGSEVAVVPAGELDLASADSLDGRVRALRRSGFDRVVIDLRRLEFMDCTGLRALLGLRNDAERRGRSLVLIPGSRSVQLLFELTRTRASFDWRTP